MTQKPTEPKIGDKCPNTRFTPASPQKRATSYSYLIPITKREAFQGHGRPLMTFDEVQEALKNLTEHGHHFRLPTN